LCLHFQEPMDKPAQLDSTSDQGQNGSVRGERSMSKTASYTVLLALALMVFVPGASPQEKSPAQPGDRGSKQAQAAKVPDEISLRSLTLPSTSEAAREAAEDANAKAQISKTTGRTPDPSKSTRASDGAILEFRPADGVPEKAAEAGTFKAKDHKKALLKNIHGSAYGISASAPGAANDEGGAVGADSASGKMNIYVEGEHVHSNTPGPH
jgi:hypothetical protein